MLSNDKSILVVAGAGSGKSFTIIGKILYLIKKLNYKQKDILCISFTNEATQSLKDKLKKYNIEINIYTFHKLALTILKDHNIDYDICPPTLLEDTIDYFFNNIIPSNQKYKKSLNIILGKTYSHKQLHKLKHLIKTFISLFKSNNYSISYFLTILKKIRFTINIKQYFINKNIILLIINIYLLYENKLIENNCIDFDDMINKCNTIINETKKIPSWKYIIVDEYQDTSFTKFKLLESIINITNANFLAVGDDFQSIYRFTGCDLHIFLNINKYLKNTKIYKLLNTYRNPQELITIAGRFIMKNKKQLAKQLISSKHIKDPIISYETNDYINTLKTILLTINESNIFVLGRNNNDINKYIDNEYKKNNNEYTYKNITFKYLTIHRSKGLEANNIILINLEDNILGLPSKIKEEKILKYVNNTKNYYPYEEERRLFYVALTRTRNRVYMIVPKTNKSQFIKELYKDNKIKKVTN